MVEKPPCNFWKKIYMNIESLIFHIINIFAPLCVGAVTVYTGWPIVCKPFEECHPVLRKG